MYVHEVNLIMGLNQKKFVRDLENVGSIFVVDAQKKVVIKFKSGETFVWVGADYYYQY